MHWARDDVNNINEKNGASEFTTFQVIEVTAPTPNFIRNDGRPTEFAWNGGIDENLNPTTEAGTTTGLFFPTPVLNEQGEGYRLAIPAEASERTLRVYLGVFGARAKFRAFLGASAAPDAETEVFIQNDLSLEKFKVGGHGKLWGGGSGRDPHYRVHAGSGHRNTRRSQCFAAGRNPD
jgi:hypothetical protein